MASAEDKTSQTPPSSEYPSLATAELIKRQKNLKSAHTKKMTEIYTYLRVQLAPPERVVDLCRELNELQKMCQEAHTKLIAAPDYNKKKEQQPDHWSRELTTTTGQCLNLAANYRQKPIETRVTRKTVVSQTSQGEQVATVEVHQPMYMQQQWLQPQQQQQQTVNDLIEMDNESRDSRQSHRSIRTFNSQPPPFQSTTNRNIQQQSGNFIVVEKDERGGGNGIDGNQEEEIEGGGRDLQNVFTINDERFNFLFPQNARRFAAASDGGFHFAYGGGGGGASGGEGGGSSVSSRTRKQLQEERKKNKEMQQQINELLEHSDEARQRVSLDGLANEIRIGQMEQLLNDYHEMINVEKRKRAEEKEDHLKQIEDMKKEINKQEAERRRDYNDLLKQMNEKLKSAQSTLDSNAKIETEVKKTLRTSSSASKEEKINDEDLEGLDRLLKMLEMRAKSNAMFESKNKSSSASASKSPWSFKSIPEEDDDVEPGRSPRSGSSAGGSRGNPIKSIFRLPKINIIPLDGNPKNWPSWKAAFEDIINSNPYLTAAEKMAILKMCLTADIRDSLGDTLNDPSLFFKALEQLASTYGNPYLVSKSYVHTLTNLPRVTSMADYKGLMNISNKIKGAVASLKHGGFQHELVSSSILDSILQKIPNELQTKWGQKVVKSLPHPLTLIDFSDWFSLKMQGEMFVKHSRFLEQSNSGKEYTGKEDKGKRHPGQKILNVNAVESKAEKPVKTYEKGKISCPLCKKSHHLSKCEEYLAKSVSERSEFVRNNRCCFRCLSQGHKKDDCQNKKIRCTVAKCNFRHHTTLHGAVASKAPVNPTVKPDEIKDDADAAKERKSNDAKKTLTVREPSSAVLLGIVPVVIRSGDKLVNTYAVLDNGSETTLIKKSLANQLELKGPSQRRRFRWFDHHEEEKDVMMVNFELTNESGVKSFKVKDGFTVDQLSVTERRCDWPSVKSQYEHLSLLDLPAIDSSQVSILIGRDVRDAHDILKYAKPPEGCDAPEANLTHFGWCVVGPVPDRLLDPNDVFYDAVSSVCQVSIIPSNQELNGLIEKFWTTEAFGVVKSDVSNYTDKEKRALEILDSTFKNVGQRCQVGLLWAKDNPFFPDNREVALRAFEQLEKRWEKDPQFARMYHTQIKDYIDQKFAEEVQLSEPTQPERVWYLPHHGVFHPHKPGKVRVVFNGSRKYKGVSLNSYLLPGPNLTNNSVVVLLSFRLKPIAVACDISKYYHMIMVPPEERSVQRFVYRPPGSKEPIKTWQMTRHFFGGTSSSCVAHYALHRTAQESSSSYPEAAKILQNNSYVDNVLYSAETIKEAIELGNGIKIVSKHGGFTQSQFASSCREVLKSLDPSELSKPDLNLDTEDLPIERVLGCVWDCETDSFKFPHTVKSKKPVKDEGIHTKRSVLSAVSTIFDPLGLLLPVIIIMKILIQDMWRLGLDWDDPLPPELLSVWLSCVAGLEGLVNLRVPRCIRRPSQPFCYQLHLCCDASERAFGAVGYLRSDYGVDGFDSRLVIAKARVAPLKQLSIPRLELQAAVMAARLASLIVKHLGLKLDVIYWSDSQTTLQWIHASSMIFLPFVGHRRTEILETSTPQQWRHIPGEMNPADDLSRGVMACHLLASHRWFNGPGFLSMPEEMWPSQIALSVPDRDDPEVSPRSFIGAIRHGPIQKHLVIKLGERTDSLTRLKRTVAWLLRFRHNYSKKTEERNLQSYLSVAEICDAFRFILQVDQRFYFLEEMKALARGLRVPEDSPLLAVTPFIDHYGILRVGGRLDLSTAIGEYHKHPIILHNKSRLARLIIQDLHRVALHAAAPRTLAEVRAYYYVLRVRTTVRSAVDKCVKCRLRRAKPQAPLQGALPSARLHSHTPPFLYVGVDYFGPIMVIVKRSRVKRWGVLFTCLVTRGVHLEIAYFLDAVSFLMAFWRFCDSRGIWPKKVWSDNGTNLTAAEEELKQLIQSLNQLLIIEALGARHIAWEFSPPSAPHFGGVWERLVQSAKRALLNILNGRTVSDESLLTAMKGAEKLMNSRPLTHVSVDPRESSPLTPFHFLVGHPSYVPNVDSELVPRKADLRKKWNDSQVIVNDFWREWSRLYIPDRIERRTWLKDRRNLAVGDLVVFMDAEERGKFPQGLITRVFKGQDDIVRSATVRTSDGSEYKRPVVKLALLELEEEESEAGVDDVANA